ncbi:MAG: hypothetical protein JWR68_194 [Polaromonas sp.]|nr:hypothetical protein [Polaromonas sp.]
MKQLADPILSMPCGALPLTGLKGAESGGFTGCRVFTSFTAITRFPLFSFPVRQRLMHDPALACG